MTDDTGGAARPSLLYIDDDEALCHLVQRGLSRRGFEVVTAGRGRDGVAAAAGRSFDVIAVDHYMPEMDGLETLAQLSAGNDPPPIIYVTGSDEVRIAIGALKAGASDYVVKSGAEDFLDLLGSALDQALDRVRLRRGKESAEQALRDANEQLESIVARQAALLREVNHRVANSLQLVSSLVQMQTMAVADGAARDALLDTQARIAAIMQVHRRLYTSDDVETVDMQEYLKSLVGELEQSLGSGRTHPPVRLTADPVLLKTDKAVSVGVMVTELVTNACKYAYAGGEPGEVRVTLRLEGGKLRLMVEDDGQGMVAGAPAQGTGLGQRVVSAMAKSLASKLEIDPRHKGVRATLAFGL